MRQEFLELDEDDLARLDAVAQAATPGPWTIQRDDHPHHQGGHHTELRIRTSWKHGQLHDYAPIISTIVGIGKTPDGPPIHTVYLRADDANFIASFNPVVARQLLRLAAIGLKAEQHGRQDQARPV